MAEDHATRHGYHGPDELDITTLARGGTPGDGMFLNSDGEWAPAGGAGTYIEVGPTPPPSPAVEDLWVDLTAGANVTISTTQPGSPTINDLWVDLTAGVNVTVSTTPPGSPTVNDLWVDTS